MAESKPCTTPMEEQLKLSKHSTAAKVDTTRYRSIIGGLRYLTHTRLGIAFAVGYVSCFMEDPREDHWSAVKRLLRYVKGTLDQAIIFPKSGGKGGLWLTVFSGAPPRQRKVSRSSLFSAMRTWRATLMGDRAPSACSSSLEWPHCLAVAEAKDRGAIDV